MMTSKMSAPEARKWLTIEQRHDSPTSPFRSLNVLIPEPKARRAFLIIVQENVCHMHDNLSALFKPKPAQNRFYQCLFQSRLRKQKLNDGSSELDVHANLSTSHSKMGSEIQASTEEMDVTEINDNEAGTLLFEQFSTNAEEDLGDWGKPVEVVGNADAEEKERTIWRLSKKREIKTDQEGILGAFEAWRKGVWFCVATQLKEVGEPDRERRDRLTSWETRMEKAWLDPLENSKSARYQGKGKAKMRDERVLDRRSATISGTNHTAAVNTLTAMNELPIQDIVETLLFEIIKATGSYNAYTRILFLRLCSQLKTPPTALLQAEHRITQLLQTRSDTALSAQAERKIREAEGKYSRRFKIGMASALGGLVMGVTGGLSAPLLAAGMGSVLTGLGMGASGAASSIGALAGSSIVTASLFGTYGGRMAGKVIGRYAREVREFAFVPLKRISSPWDSPVLKGREVEPNPRSKSEEGLPCQSPALPFNLEDGGTGHRKGESHSLISHPHGPPLSPDCCLLRVTICISGWLVHSNDVVEPWKEVEFNGSNVFALRWEVDSLLGLGKAMLKIPRSAAWAYARHEVLKRTIFGSVLVGLWPLALVKIGKLMENPFNIAKARSDKAGAILSDVLLNQVQGRRPVVLIGYSLGARVIFSCLQHLANKSAAGIIESAVLMGAPVPADKDLWRRARAVVAGRLVNVYSESDWVLAWLYRTNAVRLGAAGLQPVKGVVTVENVDVSAVVKGHGMYRLCAKDILRDYIRLDGTATPP